MRLVAQESGWPSRTWADSVKRKMFAVDSAGNVRLYLWGGSGWTGGSAIGSGWNNMTRIMAGGGGVLYAQRSDGALIWYRYTGPKSGWQNAGAGQQIGTGWNAMSTVFSGGNGVIYAVRASDKALLWYRHKNPGLGVSRWLGPKVIGQGWGGLRDLVSGGDGLIYGINSAQQLVLYNHTGAASGAATWGNNGAAKVIGSGWSSYTKLTVSPSTCESLLPRQDTRDRVVYLIHGYSPAKFSVAATDCADYFSTMIKDFPARSWTGPVWTIGFYADDTHCNHMIASGDRQRSLVLLGQDLAWYLYETHSLWNDAVDIGAHSMGGLIIREAITGTQQHWAGFPPFLDVEDVATLSTPHLGADDLTTFLCGAVQHTTQCTQMTPGSAFLKALTPNPQSRIGTDWTAIGAVRDDTVGGRSGIGYNVSVPAGTLGAGHMVLYANYDHGTIKASTGAAENPVVYRNSDGTSLTADSVPDGTVQGLVPPSGWMPAGALRTNKGLYPVDWAVDALASWRSR